MKKNLKNIVLVLSLFLFSSCMATNSLNKKSTEIAKSFYTEYIEATNKLDEKKISSVKNNYMTSVLVEEVELRSKKLEIDVVTGVNETSKLLKKMVVKDGENDEWATVVFDLMEEEGKPYKIYEIKLHFRDVNKKRLIDTLDLTIFDVDEDGDKVKTEDKTRWANKIELSDEDIAEMKRAKDYFEELSDSYYVE